VALLGPNSERLLSLFGCIAGVTGAVLTGGGIVAVGGTALTAALFLQAAANSSGLLGSLRDNQQQPASKRLRGLMDAAEDDLRHFATHQLNIDASEQERVCEALDHELLHVMPTAEEFAAGNLDPAKIAAARATALAPRWPDDIDEAVWTQMATALVEALARHALGDLEFFRSLEPHVNRALLTGVDAANTKLDNLEGVSAEMLALVRQIADTTQAPLKTLRGILDAFGEAGLDTSDLEKVGATLRAKAKEYQEFKQRTQRLTNADPEVVRLRHEAIAALDNADFDGADALLCEAEALDVTAFEREEREIDERKDTARARRLSAAESRAERGRLARLRIDYRKAAEHYAEASRLAEPADVETAWRHALAQADVLDDQGDEFGDADACLAAIALLKNRVLPLAPRNTRADDWAATMNTLGVALSTLGQRESGTTYLDEAVTAFHNALEVRTRDRVPLQWAAMQNNLGTAQSILGQRESGTKRLEEAISAYREALKESTRDRLPLQWATTQNNLGTALTTLGERESGTTRLDEAVTACRNALQERTRARAPLDWAGTQNNLGNALTALGERESGTACLEEAIIAYRNALKERTRDRVPLQWAMTQNNLAITLRHLGDRESGSARLEEAVTAFRNALEEYTRNRAPLHWAVTQNNLATALSTLGGRESGTARLEEAIIAYRNALKERTRDRVPLDWAATQNNLGNALVALGDKAIGTDTSDAKEQ